MRQPLAFLFIIGLAVGPGGARRAAAQSGAPPVNPADAQFMSGMIIHHEQAVLMAGWAPTHDAGPAVRTLCERIAISQRDEIALMERWLREHGQALPDTAWVFDYRGPAMAHAMLMAGMLTAAQLGQLDSARGPDFDRLFLTFMIQHHEGALTMVERLVNTPAAAQDNLVFQFASDISAGQTVEIDRMHRMLAALPPAPRR
jgi:uncharacterized protein (DUF305 family)